MSKDNNRTPLDQIMEPYDAGGVKIRISVDEIAASFNANPDAAVERKKMVKFIRMFAQQHAKGLSQCIKLLIMGVVHNQTEEAIGALKSYLSSLTMSYGMLANERLRIVGESEGQVKIAQPSEVPPETPDVE